MNKNIILSADSYKHSHYLQYPSNTKYINSYIESRGVDKLFPVSNPEIVHFGLQMFIKEYLQTPITKENIEDAENIIISHGLPFNREGWEYILNKHGGYLPLEIEALPEGTPIPIGTPQVQIRNTDLNVPWLTSFIETFLLQSIWYPSSVATISREIKKLIYTYLQKTSDDPENQILFKLHDFGYRGASSNESAGIGGLSHIINFMGSDTLAAIIYARQYYNTNDVTPCFSIPAAEHSTITSWGRENEIEAYRNMLNQFAKPGKMVAVVSDSYNIYDAVDKLWGQKLKKEVVDSGATLVIRPDSGDPCAVVITLLRMLSDRFGFNINSKGFKVLHPAVRLIQGDGVEYSSIEKILKEMWAQGFSVDNITFGMGGALLQKVNRDTFKYAMKANAISFDDEHKNWQDVYKDPISDSGKKSKSGVLSVTKHSGKFDTFRRINLGMFDKDLLQPVFRNGELLKEYTFNEVRKNASI